MSSVLSAPRNPNRVAVEPSNLPAWPRLVLAGQEKTGKTYEAARFTASDLVGQSFWIEIGEDSAHEYGSLGRYRIVQHNGSYEDILDAVRWAVAQPRSADGRPNLIVLDSMTVLWDMLCDEQTLAAREKAEKKGRHVVADQDLTITGEMWNRAKDRWKAVLNALRYHDGPVILVTRLEEVVVFQDGQPTKDRVWKVKGEKNLRYEATAVVQLREYNRAFLTDVRSLNPVLKPGSVEALPDIVTHGLEKLFRMLGLEQRVRSTYVTPRPEAYLEELARQPSGPQRPAQREQQAERQPQGMPNPWQVGQEIINAAKNGEESLRALRQHYGVAVLSRLMVQGRHGMVSAAEAVEAAIRSTRPAAGARADQQPRCTTPNCDAPFEGVRQYLSGFKCTRHSPQAVAAAAVAKAAAEEVAEGNAEGGAWEQALTLADLYSALDSGHPEVVDGASRILSGGDSWPPEEPNFPDDPPAESEVDPWDEIAAATPPMHPAVPERKLSGKEKVEKMLREEAEVQAGILGVPVAEHLVLPPEGSLDMIPATRLKAQLLAARPLVITALREQGRAAAAEAYEKFDVCPIPNLAALLEDPDQQAG